MADLYDDDDDRSRPEGVRILGAETAAQALGRPPADDASPRPRPAQFPADGPTWSAEDDELELEHDRDSGDERADAADAADDDDEGRAARPLDRAATEAGEDTGAIESPDLPHWSEPPTAEMASLGADVVQEGDDDFEAWATFTAGQPRFRSEGADWAEADFVETEIADAVPEPDVSEPRREPVLEAEVDAPIRPRPRAEAVAPLMFDDEPVAREAVPASAPTRRRGGSRRPPSPARDFRPADVEAPAAAPRDLPTALATAGIVAVVALLAFSLGRFWTALLASAVVALAALELSHGLVAAGRRLAVPLVLVAVAAAPVAAQQYGLAALPLLTFLVVVFSMLWYLWEVSPGRPAGGVATSLMVFCYVGLLGGYAGLLLQAPDGIGLLLGAVLPVIAYDVFGFFVGSQFGKTHIAPRISPNKTVEGTVAGVIGAIVVSWLIVGQIAPWNGTRGFVLGCLVAAAAFFGDLAESMIKRDLGVKDFGSLLPGHGGVLDRFDGLLLALPVTYYFALHVNQVF